MIKYTLALVTIMLSACTSPSFITSTLGPTAAQRPMLSADEVFLNDLYHRLEADKAISNPGKRASISLYENESTFSFGNNHNRILQFDVFELPKDKQEIKETALRLIDMGSRVAEEKGVALSGVEVVFYLASGEPWLAIGSVPPWRAEQFIVAPLHPEYIERLQQEGILQPTPEPEPSPQNFS